jgi:hypothetical protein
LNKFREFFEAELEHHGIAWCRGCDRRSSHDNGGAFAEGRTVHYNRDIATRSTLYVGLHEIAHVVLGHTGHRHSKLRAFQREAEAEQWAAKRMRELGIPVPRKQTAEAKRYVAKKKRRGDRIAAARAKAQRPKLLRPCGHCGTLLNPGFRQCPRCKRPTT